MTRRELKGLTLETAFDPIGVADSSRVCVCVCARSFEWCECDMRESVEVDEVYKLLNLNYVEDDDNMFRCVECIALNVCYVLGLR